MVTVGWSWYYGTCARFYHCSIFGHHLWCREVRFLKNYWRMAKVFLIAIFEIQWLWQSIYRRYAFPGKILNSILNCNMILLLQTRLFSQTYTCTLYVYVHRFKSMYQHSFRYKNSNTDQHALKINNDSFCLHWGYFPSTINAAVKGEQIQCKRNG